MPLWMEGARTDPVAAESEDVATVQLGHRTAEFVGPTRALAIRGWEVTPYVLVASQPLEEALSVTSARRPWVNLLLVAATWAMA